MPSSLLSQPSDWERRYDRETVEKVIALASRLQHEEQETLTAQEIKTLGAEVGLNPDLVQRALHQVTATKADSPFSQTEEAISKIDVWKTLVLLVAPLLYSWLALFAPIMHDYRHPTLILLLRIFSILVAPWPLSGLFGYLSGNRKVGTILGLEFVFGLLGWIYGYSYGHMPPGQWLGWLLGYGVCGGLAAGTLGYLGARFREGTLARLFDRRTENPNMSRREMVELMFTLQKQLEAQKQRRAFLSVEMIGVAERKGSAPEADVAFTFSQFRRWIEEIVTANGGQMLNTAGEGAVGVFPAEINAIQAAVRMQRGIAQFNATFNRLPSSIEIRCGVAAGEVPVETAAPGGMPRNPVIDRAVAFQQRAAAGDIVMGAEAVPAALLAGEAVTPCPISSPSDPLFSWQAGQSTLRSYTVAPAVSELQQNLVC